MLVIVIGLLKALGRDQMTYSKPKSLVQIFQVIQRQEKGIDLIMIIEVTTHTADIWKRARTTVAMVCLSPKMAFSPGFQKVPNSEVALGPSLSTKLTVDERPSVIFKRKDIGCIMYLSWRGSGSQAWFVYDSKRSVNAVRLNLRLHPR